VADRTPLRNIVLYKIVKDIKPNRTWCASKVY